LTSGSVVPKAGTGDEEDLVSEKDRGMVGGHKGRLRMEKGRDTLEKKKSDEKKTDPYQVE
jgi:hypothetical protein